MPKVKGSTYMYLADTGGTTGAYLNLSSPFVSVKEILPGYDFVLDEVRCSVGVKPKQVGPIAEVYAGEVNVEIVRSNSTTYQRDPIFAPLFGGQGVLDWYMPLQPVAWVKPSTRGTLPGVPRLTFFDHNDVIVIRVSAPAPIASLPPVRVLLVGRNLPKDGIVPC